MKILSINTAFSKSYVAVENEGIVVSSHMDSQLKQSENILGLIHKTLLEAGVKINDLDAIAVVIGPGSFTGIRIGASLAKGFCSAFSRIKRICISSLDLVAYSYAKKNMDNDFWVVLNALSGNLFSCKYNKQGEKLIDPCLISETQQDQIIGDVVGIEEENITLCNKHISFNCEFLLEYSKELFKNGCFSNDFTPLYMRKSQAEENMS